MRYLDPKFNTPANSRAYVEGWERCFREGETKPVEPVSVEEVTEDGCKVVVNE